MTMEESSILTDCIESLKHAAEQYLHAAFLCDTDSVRDTLQDIVYDRCEQEASVFSLMHQMEIYKTEEAPKERVDSVKARFSKAMVHMESRHEAADEAGERL